MATAVCGLQPGGKPAKTRRAHRRRAKDSQRRQAALLFLNNISLDGRPQPQPPAGEAEQTAAEEPRLGERDGRQPAGASPPRGPGLGAIAGATDTAGPAGAGSPSTFTGIPAATSPGPAALAAVGPNEVFVEGGGAAEPPAPDTPRSPGPRTRSTPAVLSPAPAGGAADPRQRLRNVSGSPGPRVPKKVHFIKSMRQYDTRGCSDLKVDSQRQRLSSVVAADMLPSLEGVELGDIGKTVSYAQFLYPTNALVRQKSSGAVESCTAQTPQSRFRGNGQRSIPARMNSTVAQDPCMEEVQEYDPNLLSDPQWPCGRHKRVLIFASYVTTVIEYVKPCDLKKDMNETFREKFPHIKLTLSKIKSLKREMRAVSEECSLQPVTTAMAFVYFEKLVLQGRLNKQNRKLVTAACVLLAAKISSDLRKADVKQLIDKLEERFRINRRELIPLEFSVLVALEMGLYLPESKVMPHYRRLVQQG
ncbi:CDK5 and ABL1 enzyme substrate 2-like isoform X2 [Cololabis saira]|uniref:CDK5 and ABL1 enzyme substrate 2-like isoform X2 n=1 Tax=Cololabis saira TaxID=129043 RepID=UPI002AD2095E|nr:CDK5 and ABL1 enzyme substrate 2-like isoform X2 [Cololabis saira]